MKSQYFAVIYQEVELLDPVSLHSIIAILLFYIRVE